MTSSSGLFAQTEPNVKPVSISFYDAIKKIENVHNLKFAFDHDLFSNVFVHDLNVEQGIEDILDNILDENRFTYELSGSSILLIPRSEQVLFDVSLSGIVRDDITGEPLPNAAVYLKNSGQYVLTNRDGKFNFLKIPSDTTQLEVRYLGYAINNFRIKDLPKQKYAEIALTNNPEILNEITVSDRKDIVFEISDQSSKVSVDIDEFKSMANYGEPDVFRSVQLLPGISGTNETSSGLVIRGGTPEQNLVLFDGFTVYQLDHFFGIFSAFNSNVIKDVQLYKSGYGARYGSRISGVMDITGKTGNIDKPAVNVGINMISSNIVAEIPISNKLSFLVAGRRSYTDVVKSGLYKKLFNHVKSNDPSSITQTEDSLFLDPNFYFFDVNAKLTYRFDENNLISLSAYNGKDNLLLNDEEFEEGTFNDFFRYEYQSTETTNWGNEGLSMRYARQWSSNLFTELSLSGSTFFKKSLFEYSYEYEDVGFEENEESSFGSRNDVSENSIKLDGEYKFRDDISLGFGLFSSQYELLDQTFEDGIAIENDLTQNGKESVQGIYSELRFNPNGRSQITIGGRLSSYSGVLQSSYFEPRVSMNYRVSDHLNLKSSYSKHYQFIVNSKVQSSVINQNSVWQFSDGVQIPVLKSNQYALGFTFNRNGFTFDVEGYYRNVDGLTEIIIDEFVDESISTTGQIFAATGKGTYRGLDVLLKKRIKNYQTWLAYSSLSAENTFDLYNDGLPFGADEDQRHEIKYVNMLNVNRWDFSMTWIYGTGKPYTPGLQETVVGADSLQSVLFAELDLNRKNTLRLPSYHRMDISIGYNTSVGKTKCTFGLNLLNVYNRRNIKGYRFGTNFNDTSGDTIERKAVKLLDFTPSVFMNFSF